MNDSLVAERVRPAWPRGGASALPPGGDVFDAIVENERWDEVVAVRRLALIARACAEYDVVLPDLYGDETAEDTDAWPPDGVEGWVQPGADGTPYVGEFLSTELAPLLGCTIPGARSRMADALNLQHRHPRLWAAVTEHGTVTAWKAVQVANECVDAGLTWEACQQVDRELVDAIELLGWRRARRLLKGLIVRTDPAAETERARRRRDQRGVWAGGIEHGQVRIEAKLDAADGLALEAQVARIATLLLADPDRDPREEPESLDVRRAKALAMLAIPHVAAAFLEDHAAPASAVEEVLSPVPRFDPAKLRPRATLLVHVHADDLATPDENGEVPMGSGVARVEGHGPIDLASLHLLLNGCQVSVRPMVDLNGPPATDAYEVPDRLREHLIHRNPAEVFPFGDREARRCDLDHTVPYDRWAAQGATQTCAENLGPLGRTSHRVKTHGGWELEQLRPGIFWWRSRAGFEYVVTPRGTIRLGRAVRGGSAPPGGSPTRPPTPYAQGVRLPPGGWDDPPPF